jgi:predicted RNA-binding protein with TRAM domain
VNCTCPEGYENDGGTGCKPKVVIPVCGNGILEEGEECENYSQHCINCKCEAGYIPDPDYPGFCKQAGPVCGNGILEEGEECEVYSKNCDSECKCVPPALPDSQNPGFCKQANCYLYNNSTTCNSNGCYWCDTYWSCLSAANQCRQCSDFSSEYECINYQPCEWCPILQMCIKYDSPCKAANNPPVLETIGNKTVDEGNTLTFTIAASDPDGGDVLTFDASSLPTGAGFDPGTRTFTWTPGYGQAGSYQNVLFRVTDNGTPMASDAEAITITVGNVNRPPVLDPIGNKTVDEGDTLTFTIAASDPDGGDVLTFDASSLPTGAGFDPGTRTFTWTPGYGQVGSYPNVLFTVTDNGTPPLSASEAITITVGNVNRPPVLNSIGSRTVNEGEKVEIVITATDPDGDGLTYSAGNLPAGAGFDPITQKFSWTPGYDQVGSYPNVLFTVTDNGTPPLSASEAITITVGNVNRPPVLNPIGSRTVNEGEKVEIVITATDPDGDGLTYSASNLPAGATFDPIAQKFSWTPGYDQAGSYQVTFNVSDGELSASETITITVNDVNRPPVALCKDVTAAAGSSCAADASIDNGSSDPDGDPITLSPTPSGPYPKGTTSVTLKVTDSKGASSQCTGTVTVLDTTPPSITSYPGNIVTSTDPAQCSAGVTYNATAMDNCPGVTVVGNPPSGSAFPKGTTTVIATATDTSGNTATRSFTVTVVDNQPPAITPPPAITAYTGVGATSCGAFISDLGTAIPSDNCPGVTFTRSGVPAGNFFPSGTTPITYTAKDSAGNTASATQTVTVIDDTPPTITGMSANPSVLWPPNHKMVNVTVNYNTTDNCAQPACQISSVTCNEPISSSDYAIADAHHVNLRADRLGSGNGRVYTITVTCTDAYGNPSSQAVKVTVPHDQGKK